MGHNCVLWLAVLTIFSGNVWSFALPADFREKQCTPGETKQVDCNSCWCTPQGYWGCTRLGCERRQTRDTEKQCTPGEGKQVDCNSCSCSPDGYWECTRKGCGIRERRDTETTCSDYETKWDGNNHCICLENKWNCQDVGGPCKAGETKMQDCNHCWCTETGLWACTLMGCLKYNQPVLREKRDAETAQSSQAIREKRNAESACTEDAWKFEGGQYCKCKDNKWDCQINEFAQPCKPGERKAAGCNGCWCTDDGKWACTLMRCPPIPRDEIQHQEAETTQSTQAIREKRNAESACTEDAWKFEGDKYCKCKDNKWDCQINEFAQSCKPGERKAAGCNGCWCTDDGRWACTLMRCPPIHRDEIQHQEAETTQSAQAIREKRNADEECTDDETKWEGNNYCVCHDKKWRCQDVGGPCKPGETKMEDCNHCFCTETGLWGCTLKGCSSYNLIREERSADEECTDEETKWEGNNYCVCHDKKWRCEDVGGPCKPGETKMEDCNHCFCTETGLWGCTLMGCSKYNLAIREERSAETTESREPDHKPVGCEICRSTENGTWICAPVSCVDPEVCAPGERKSMENDTVRCVCMSGQWKCLKHETGESCTGYQKKTSGCYTCWCSLQGTWECSMDLCVGDNLAGCREDERRWLNNDTVQCICWGGQWKCSEIVDGRCRYVGEYKQDGCNDCFCTDVELWGCTRRKCVPDYKGDGSCTRGDTRWTGSEYCHCGPEEKWVCEDVGGPCKFKSTKSEECNQCKCEHTGFWKCGKKNCTAELERESGGSCRLGQLKHSGCYHCWCNHKLTWECTTELCEEDNLNRCEGGKRRWLNNETVLCICDIGAWKCSEVINGRCRTEGEYQRQECNDCFCTDVELWACTRRNCVPDYKGDESCNTTGEARWSGPEYSEYCHCTSDHKWKCEDLGGPCRYNETKMEDCNLCKCNLQGLWDCEKNECVKEVAKREADQFTCTPGQTFQKECNSCTCTKDGKNAVCTLKNCTLEE